MIKLLIIEKRIIKFDNDIEKLFIYLINKFKKNFTITIDAVFRKRCIIRNINIRCELREYI